jgi:hypothetical protein
VRDEDIISTTNPERVWLIHANGGRQLIDPRHFDMDALTHQASRVGGKLVVERWVGHTQVQVTRQVTPKTSFEPPVTAVGPLFRSRLDRIHTCKEDFTTHICARPTNRVLGNYYRIRKLIRIYSHDTHLGRRPLEDLFDTYLHEVAHHLEYTEYDSFNAKKCGRVHGTMHSRLFWKILGELKTRWSEMARGQLG